MDSLDCKTRLSSLEFRVAQLEKMLQDQLVLQKPASLPIPSPPKDSPSARAPVARPMKPPTFQLNDDIRYWIIEAERYLVECKYPRELWVTYARKFTDDALNRYVKSMQMQKDPNVRSWDSFKAFLVDTYAYVHPENREEVKLESYPIQTGNTPERPMHTPVKAQAAPLYQDNHLVAIDGGPFPTQQSLRNKDSYNRVARFDDRERCHMGEEPVQTQAFHGVVGRSGYQRGKFGRGCRTSRALRRFGM
ncbi:hypothetical protein KEM56_004312 [Ascosphaera pollenicola]|nr:hypothetical protein KEM56_004312 [Ascosphaera pollenicola]